MYDIKKKYEKMRKKIMSRGFNVEAGEEGFTPKL